MPLDLAKLTDLTSRNESVEASAANLLTTLFAEVQANINNPVALQALVDRGTASTDALAAAIANTSGTAAV
jgi:hypothetical protein